MKSLKDFDVKNKVVLLRVDFNVSMDGETIKDDFRIRATLPTITYLQDHGAKILILAHLGRPGGKSDSAFSLHPLVGHLSKLLKQDVGFFSSYDLAKKNISSLKSGEVAILENLRFDPREEAGDKEFAKELAALGDVYVNDAFSVSHRKHASVYAIAKLMPSVAGLLLMKEIDALDRVHKFENHPVVFIMGGAKVETKIKILARLADKIDIACLGGLIANSFLAARKTSIGKSRLEADFQQYLAEVNSTDAKIYLPLDVVVSTDPSGDEPVRTVQVNNIASDEMILDIGPQTVKLFSAAIEKAGAVFWNGPMGIFEVGAFAKGTRKLAEALKNTEAHVVVGGGDVVRAIQEAGVQDNVSYISTGGGAMLEYLAEGTLPAIDALE